MPELAKHQSATITKLLLIGDTGAGKTGSLASLAGAGYNLRIMDLDNGLDILANLLKDPKSPYGPEALSRVRFETLTDPMRPVNNKLVPKQATVWQRATKLLDSWPDCGGVLSWTSQDVLVIDSLTFLCTAAMNLVLMMNARLGQQPQQSDWFAAQQMVESMLQALYDENVRCNVIMTGHLTYIGEDGGPQHGYPASLGKALSPRIGRYFNTLAMVRSSGSGDKRKQRIVTKTSSDAAGLIELKNSNPVRVKPDYPVETGLADLFRDIRGEPGA